MPFAPLLANNKNENATLSCRTWGMTQKTYFSESDFREKRIFFTLQKWGFFIKLIVLRCFSFQNEKKGHQLKNITLLHSIGVVSFGNISFCIGFSLVFAVKNILFCRVLG